VIRDDLGAPVDTARPVGRIVSLVPSLTEAVAASAQEALVGATDWCTHPADLDVTRIRGTKNPDLTLIKKLRPDVVLANKEENRELDVRRLREAGVAVWVTVTESVPQALRSLCAMFSQCLRWPVPAWLDEVRGIWDRPAPAITARTVIPIWRDPWMVVGSSTFTGDLVRRLGVENAFATHPRRYPHVELAQLQQANIDFVLLPDEPYPFSPADGPESFPDMSSALVSGRLLTWYGPSLLSARRDLCAAIGIEG